MSACSCRTWRAPRRRSSAWAFASTPLSPQRHRLAPGAPLVAAGTANRLAMLREGYVEILTPVADTAVAGQLRQAIARYAGLHLIAFGSDDAVAAQAHLAAAGFAPQPVIDLERTVARAPRVSPWCACRPARWPKAACSTASTTRRSWSGSSAGSRSRTARGRSPASCSASRSRPKRPRAMAVSSAASRSPAPGAWSCGSTAAASCSPTRRAQPS